MEKVCIDNKNLKIFYNGIYSLKHDFGDNWQKPNGTSTITIYENFNFVKSFNIDNSLDVFNVNFAIQKYGFELKTKVSMF